MGLDMYAYIARKKSEDFNSAREIAYWRKRINPDQVQAAERR